MVTLSSQVILAIAVIFGVLFISLIALITSFIFSMKGVGSHKEDGDLSEKLADAVRSKSVRILEDAHKKAREILGNVRGFSERSESIIAKEAQKNSEDYLKIYESAVNEAKLNAIKTIQDIPKDIKPSLDNFLKEYREELGRGVTGAEKKLDQALSDARVKYELELDRQKEVFLKKLNERAVSIVGAVVRETLGKSIDDSEHEKLVLRALDQAKKDGVFNV